MPMDRAARTCASLNGTCLCGWRVLLVSTNESGDDLRPVLAAVADHVKRVLRTAPPLFDEAIELFARSRVPSQPSLDFVEVLAQLLRSDCSEGVWEASDVEHRSSMWDFERFRDRHDVRRHACVCVVCVRRMFDSGRF